MKTRTFFKMEILVYLFPHIYFGPNQYFSNPYPYFPEKGRTNKTRVEQALVTSGQTWHWSGYDVFFFTTWPNISPQYHLKFVDQRLVRCSVTSFDRFWDSEIVKCLVRQINQGFAVDRLKHKKCENTLQSEKKLVMVKPSRRHLGLLDPPDRLFHNFRALKSI